MNETQAQLYREWLAYANREVPRGAYSRTEWKKAIREKANATYRGIISETRKTFEQNKTNE